MGPLCRKIVLGDIKDGCFFACKSYTIFVISYMIHTFRRVFKMQ